MVRSWFRHGFVGIIALALVLVVAAACGSSDEAAPEPTPTPINVADIVAQALAGQTAGVTAADVASRQCKMPWPHSPELPSKMSRPP